MLNLTVTDTMDRKDCLTLIDSTVDDCMIEPEY